jgi:hypothetical protein
VAARKKADAAAKRVRHLLALDASNVMTRLKNRHDDMVTLFSRTRDRSPLLGAVHSCYQTVTFGELVLLEPAEQRAVNRFYERLGELRWYLQYTEDMPLQVRQCVSQSLIELDVCHRRLTQVIGPPDDEGAPVVEGVVSRAGAQVTTLSPASKARR